LGPLLEKVNDQIVSMMGSLENSGDHLLGLISEILDFAKIESGSLGLEKEPTSTEQIVRSVIDQMRPAVEQKGLKFITNIDDVGLTADVKRIQQVLFNVIGNATKFTEKGMITLDVYAQDDEAIFSVTDTGIGIPDDQLDKVFEAFQQVDLSANRKYNGTGLGLAIARDMAVAHSGELTVISTFGTGSTFTLSLPRTGADAATQTYDETIQTLVA
jgi:signal transduction histidine kinase